MGVESLPPPPPPLAAPIQFVGGVYRSLRARLLVVRVLLVLTTVGAGVFVVLAVRALSIKDWSSHAGREAGELAAIAGGVTTLCFLASYVASAVWTSRAYRNLIALGVSDLRFTPGWGAGAWFVPFLNLVRPKQIVDDIWRATDGDPARWSWRSSRVDASVHAWWAFLVLSLFLAPRAEIDELDRRAIELGTVGAACLVAFSVLGWLVTSQLTSRLQSLAERRGLPLNPTSTLTTRWGVALVAVAAVVGLGIGAAVELPDESGPVTVSVHDLEVGDCFGEPGAAATPTRGDDVTSIAVVPCDAPHLYELIDVAVHDAPSYADFPGADALFEFGAERCVEDFEEIVGTPLPQSRLEIVLITPLADGWDAGDREVHCVAVRGDGRPLEQTVAGSGL